jgi:hypothetical protein
MAKLDANQEKAAADRKADKEEMETDMKAWREEIRLVLFETTNTRKETTACQEMEACLEEEEQTSVEMKPEVAQKEVPKEDAVVQPVKGRKRRYRGRKQIAGRRGEPNELTRGDCGSWMKLAAACRKVSHRATVAWPKETSSGNLGLKESVNRGTNLLPTEI